MEKEIYTKEQAENLTKILNIIAQSTNKNSNIQYEDITVTTTGLVLGFKSYKHNNQ